MGLRSPPLQHCKDEFGVNGAVGDLYDMSKTCVFQVWYDKWVGSQVVVRTDSEYFGILSS